MTTYFKVLYDTQAGGEYVADAENFTEVTWTGGGRGQIISDFPHPVLTTTGKLHVALIAGPLPTDGQTLTQGAVTADANGNATTLLYPAYFREDVSVTTNGTLKDIRWVGPAADANGVIPTHSHKFDGQTTNLTVGDLLTYSGGQTAELIRVNNDTGATGEIEVRFTSSLDAGLPVDGDTFSDEGTGDGTVQGETHARSYTPFNIHRLLADLNDDDQFFGNDVLSSIDPTPSAKDTDQIIRLIGGANVDDTMILHMYGGSIEQLGNAEKYSGLDVQVTSPNANTRPVLIQFNIATGLDAIVPDKYSNAWNPDSIAGNIRIMIKVRENNVDIDGRRIRGKLLEYGDNYFEGGTTLGDATTSLALFSSTDGNNDTAVGTVAAYATTITEGFQTQTYGATTGDFSAILNYNAQTSKQSYEYTKWLQTRVKTSPEPPTLFGRDARLVTGVNRNFAWDAQVGNLTEDEIIAWGTSITYSAQAVSNFILGEAVTFVGSGAQGRVLYDNDAGATGEILVGDLVGTPLATDTILAADSGTTADVDVVTLASRAGIGLLIAWDDDGATGNVYYQALGGLDPIDNQLVYGRSSDATVTIFGAVASRTINNQWVGLYTGTNFQTNFGIGVLSTDAVLGDLNRSLGDVQIGVPNNQSGVITNLLEGDRAWAYDWDGSTVDSNGDAVPRWDQLSNDALLNGAAVASIVVTEAIPADTPQVAALRVTNDEGIRVLIAYSSWSVSTFTLTSTYNFSGSGVNDSVAATNDIAIAYIDRVIPAATTTASFTGIYGGDRQMAIRVLRGDNSPIVPFKANPVFGSAGFSVAAGRISDA